MEQDLIWQLVKYTQQLNINHPGFVGFFSGNPQVNIAQNGVVVGWLHCGESYLIGASFVPPVSS